MPRDDRHRVVARLLDANHDMVLQAGEILAAMTQSLDRVADKKIASGAGFSSHEIEMLSPVGLRLSADRLTAAYGHFFTRVESPSSQDFRSASAEALTLASTVNAAAERDSPLDRIAASSRLFVSEVATGVQANLGSITDVVQSHLRAEGRSPRR